VKTTGFYMLCGPKGDDKSLLVWQLAERNPVVILVDLQNGGIDQAVCAVAAAIGYNLDYTADELAAKAAGFNVPVINAQQSVADFEELLLVFEQACDELRAEGALREKHEPLERLAEQLREHVPVLILECVSDALALGARIYGCFHPLLLHGPRPLCHAALAPFLSSSSQPRQPP
jgi:hypothetical protein